MIATSGMSDWYNPNGLGSITTEELVSMKRIVAMQPRPRDAREATFPLLTPDENGGGATGRVCIVLPTSQKTIPSLLDYVSAYKGLVRLLLNTGHVVEIVYGPVLTEGKTGRKFEELIEREFGRRAKCVSLPAPNVWNAQGPLGQAVTTPYVLYEWLKKQSFDIVHAPDCGGALFYCLAAKELGAAFQNTHFCVTATAPLLWIHLTNAQPVGGLQWLARTFIERRSVELADTLISPSQYLLRWMLRQGYRLPVRSFIQPWMPGSGVSANNVGTVFVREIVFAGELEPRKGLPEFVDAIVRLARSGVLPDRVVFAGPTNPEFPARAFIKQKLGKLGVPWVLRPDLHGRSAVEYVAGGGRVAVVASQEDNAPWSVQEMLRRGVPVLVSAAEGLVEQVLSVDRPNIVFALHPGKLAARLQDALSKGAPVARPAADLDAIGPRWRKWHEERIASVRSITKSQETTERPLVTVCLMHFNRPELVQQAIASIKAQNYPNIEVVLVDDGSTDPSVPAVLDMIEADFSSRGWRVIRQENLYLGAARNTAARNAHGKYLFFLDDDNVLKPHALNAAVSIAEREEIDILTSFSDSFSGDTPPDENADQEITRIVQLGDDISFGLFRNGFGDSNALIRRKVFEQLGGNTEDYGVGKDDQEFFARAVLLGHRLRHLPEALFWARQPPVRLRHLHYSPHAGHFRVAQVYRDLLPAALQNFLLVAQGQQLELEAWDPNGEGRIGGQAAKTLASARGALFNSVGTIESRGELRRNLERTARRAFDFQTTLFSWLIAAEVWSIQKFLLVFRAAKNVLSGR